MRMHRVHLTMCTESITAFSNRYGVVVWTGKNNTKTISVDTNPFLKRSKTALFSFENGLVWTGPNLSENRAQVDDVKLTFTLLRLEF